MNDRYWEYKYRYYRAMTLIFGCVSVFWALLVFALDRRSFEFALGLFIVIASAFIAGHWYAMMIGVRTQAFADGARAASGGANGGAG